MRNSLYIAYGCPKTWRNELKLGIREVKNATVVCDAMFKEGKKHCIIEVDHQQKMKKNKSKIEKYRKLIEFDFFEEPPMFIWITTTQYRKDQLMKLSEGLEVQIFFSQRFPLKLIGVRHHVFQKT